MNKKVIFVVLSIAIIVMSITVTSALNTSASEVSYGLTSVNDEIATAEELMNIGMMGQYVLTADIDFTGKTVTPIGTEAAPFKGTLDGNGYKITGISFTDAQKYVGLFGVCEGATISNLKVEASSIGIATNTSDEMYAAIICAYAKANTRISNCTVSGDINIEKNGNVYAAGICAYADRSLENTSLFPSFEKCRNFADITVDSTAYASGSVYVAGIAAGGQFSDIKLAKNSGELTAKGAIGATAAGISAAYGYKAIDQCVNNGGIFAKSKSSDAIAGGITAFSVYGDISNSYNSGCITSEGKIHSIAGGICGESQLANTFKKCYSVGPVQIAFEGYCGTLAASASALDSFDSNYVLDTLTADIIDKNPKTDAAVRLSDENMKKSDSFLGFDFDNVWYMPSDGEYSYPMLAGFKTEVMCGDVNGDNFVTSLDTVVLARYIAGWSGYAQMIVPENCDMDSTDDITSLDLVILIRHIAGWKGYSNLPYEG